LNYYFWFFLAFAACILLWEHFIVRKDLKRINAAFFTANGLLSLLFLAAILGAIYLSPSP